MPEPIVTTPPATLSGQAALPLTGDPPAPPVVPAPAAAPAAPAEPAPKVWTEPPQTAWVNRAKREAAVIVKRELGCTLEEAKAIIAKTKEQPAGGGQSAAENTAAAAVEKATKEAEALRVENEKLKSENEEIKSKSEAKIQALNDKQFEAALTTDALRAGINDTDYALSLYRRRVLDAKEKGEAFPEPAAYFASLRDAKPFLFSSAAPPVVPTVAPTTAPAESAAPGGEPPKPTTPGASPPPKTADDMTGEEFNAHLRRSGYVPGT